MAATFVTDIEGKWKPIESEIRKDPKVESSTLNLKPSALFSISALNMDQIVRCCAVRRNASKPPLFVSVLHLRSSVSCGFRTLRYSWCWHMSVVRGIGSSFHLYFDPSHIVTNDGHQLSQRSEVYVYFGLRSLMPRSPFPCILMPRVFVYRICLAHHVFLPCPHTVCPCVSCPCVVSRVVLPHILSSCYVSLLRVSM